MKAQFKHWVFLLRHLASILLRIMTANNCLILDGLVKTWQTPKSSLLNEK